jgi:hypothetical protein
MRGQQAVIDRPVIIKRQCQGTGHTKSETRFHRLVYGLRFTVCSWQLSVADTEHRCSATDNQESANRSPQTVNRFDGAGGHLGLSTAFVDHHSQQKLLLGRGDRFILGAEFPTEPLARRNAPITIADLGNLCSDLERFKLPSAVGDLNADAFAFWNASFCERMDLTPEELAQVKLSTFVRYDEQLADLSLGKEQAACRFGSLPCAIKRPANDGILPASAIKNEQGLLLLLVDSPAHDLKFEGYIQGRIVGREEEANRMRKFFHDLLSSKILVASFLAHSIHDNLARREAPEIKDLHKVTNLLDEVIDSIVQGFERSP